MRHIFSLSTFPLLDFLLIVPAHSGAWNLGVFTPNTSSPLSSEFKPIKTMATSDGHYAPYESQSFAGAASGGPHLPHGAGGIRAAYTLLRILSGPKVELEKQEHLQHNLCHIYVTSMLTQKILKVNYGKIMGLCQKSSRPVL